MFFVFNRVEAGHMAAGPGRSIPPPALDTGDKVGTSTRFITALAIFSSWNTGDMRLDLSNRYTFYLGQWRSHGLIKYGLSLFISFSFF